MIESRRIFVEPSYPDFFEDRLFTAQDGFLNRDDQLAPYRSLRRVLEHSGHTIRTSDSLWTANPGGAEYYSLGSTEGWRRAAKLEGVTLRACAIFEPPVVAPSLYSDLPALTQAFEEVYVHNTHGDQYSFRGVDRSRLRKLYWFQQFPDVLLPLWARKKRREEFVVINSNKRPRSRRNELYSTRIRAVASLAQQDAVHLYGSGWDRWLLRGAGVAGAVFLPNVIHRRELKRTFRGTPSSKFETLSQYDFSLCLENMVMDGFITEKLFDCLYAGTIPVYLGPKDISQYVSSGAFIDVRQFSGWDDLLGFARSLSPSQIQEYRERGREFLTSEESRPFQESLFRIFDATTTNLMGEDT